MEPMKAPQAELAAKRRRQMAGVGEEEGAAAVEELGAEFNSPSELVLGESADAISLKTEQ